MPLHPLGDLTWISITSTTTLLGGVVVYCPKRPMLWSVETLNYWLIVGVENLLGAQRGGELENPVRSGT